MHDIIRYPIVHWGTSLPPILMLSVITSCLNSIFS